MRLPGNKTTGRLLILLCALMWSTGGLFAKAPVFDNWPLGTRGVMLAFWRALFAGLLILPFVRRPRFNRRIVCMALCFAAMNVTYLQAMTLTTAANAIWLQSTAPLWVFVIGRWLSHDSLDRRDLVSLGFGIVGVGLILFFELRDLAANSGSAYGVVLGLAAGITYAVVVLSIRESRSENGAWLVVVNHLTACLLLGPYSAAVGTAPTGGQLLVLVAFGLLQMGLPYLLFARALRYVSSQEASSIGLVEPVVLPLWVLLVWHEKAAWWTMAGAASILAGLVLRYLRGNGTAAGRVAAIRD